MKFESTLADRIAHGKGGYKGWLTVVGACFAVFLVLNVTSGSMAGHQAVIQLGSKSSVALYADQFDGKSKVVMLGAVSSVDWICVKVPFKGYLSDLESISFCEFIAQSGGDQALEPYIVLRLTEGRSLICDPVTSYSNGTWDLPLLEWQLRDTANKGTWTYTAPNARSLAAPLISWIRTMGNANVLSVCLFIGQWEISSPYQCYVGDLIVNGDVIDLSNAARVKGSVSDLPPGF